MEPVSAAASIVSIIAFSGQALKAIDSFKRFCKEFEHDAIQNFLRDLETAASLLNDTMILAKKSKEIAVDQHLDLRAQSLSIQVEDCAEDLEKWLKTAKRLKSERKKGSSEKMDGSKLRFFNSILTALSKSSRDDTAQRLKWHQDNIRTSLEIFGRLLFNACHTVSKAYEAH